MLGKAENAKGDFSMPRAKKRKTFDLQAVKATLTAYYMVDCRLSVYRDRMQAEGKGRPGKVAFIKGIQAKGKHAKRVTRDLIRTMKRINRASILTSEHWKGFRDLAFEFDPFRLPARREHLMKRTRGKVYGHAGRYNGRMPLAKGAEGHAYTLENGAPLPSALDLQVARSYSEHKAEGQHLNATLTAIAEGKAEYHLATLHDLASMVARSLRLTLAQPQPGNLRLAPTGRQSVIGMPRIIKRT